MTSTTKLGYLRVSTGKQDEQLQHDALDKAGVLKRNRYVDHGVSGKTTKRDGLDALQHDIDMMLANGETPTVVLYRLDRLGRSTAHVAGLMAEWDDKGVIIESIADGLNTATPMGKAMLQMAAIFAELERSIIAERTVAGLASAKAQGRTGGRPKVTDGKRAAQAQALRDAGQSVPDIAKALGISIATAYRITTTRKPDYTLGAV